LYDHFFITLVPTLDRSYMLKNKFLFATFFLLGFMLPTSGFSAKYNSAEDKMSITMPGEYNVTEENHDYGKTVKVSGEFETYGSFISYTLRNETISDHYNIVKTGLDGFVEALNSNITSQSDWLVKKNRSVHAFLKMNEYDKVVDYGCILAGNIQYQIAIIGEPTSWIQKKSNAIFKSFKISK